MNAQQVQKKQQYLRENILESGYDPEDFIEFLHQHTHTDQTPNIQQFSMKQIQKIVGAYKQFCQQKKNSVKQQTDKSNKQQIKQQPPSDTKNLHQKKVRIQYERYAPIFDYQIKGVIPCIQSEMIIKKPVQITVTEMETKQIQGFLFGIGSKTQYYYHIKSNLLKGAIKRLSEDFDWLNSTLSRLYPFLALPQLEPVRKDLKDPYTHRMKDIEQYLQYLSRKNFLLTTHIFIDFLTISSDKMEKYKKTYDSMGFVKGVSLLKLPEGEASIQLSQNTRDFYTQSKQFSKKTSKIHQNLSIAIQKMIQSYRNAIQETYTVVDLFAQLYDTYNDISNKFPNMKKDEYGDALVNLNNLFVGIGDSLKGTADKVEKYAKNFYRFTSGYDKNIQKLIKNVKQTQSQYLQFKYNLHRKKQRCISDPSKWEIDTSRGDVKKLSKDELMKVILPKQTLAENQLKNWYAFNLKNQQTQFSDYLLLSTHRYYKVFKSMAKELLVSDKNYLEALTKFIGQCRRGIQ